MEKRPRSVRLPVFGSVPGHSVQVCMMRAPWRRAVRTASSTSRGLIGRTPSIMSISRMPYRAAAEKRQAYTWPPSFMKIPRASLVERCHGGTPTACCNGALGAAQFHLHGLLRFGEGGRRHLRSHGRSCAKRWRRARRQFGRLLRFAGGSSSRGEQAKRCARQELPKRFRHVSSEPHCSRAQVSPATGGAGLNVAVTKRPALEVSCERTGQQLKPFFHWCVCPKVSMAPGRRLNIGEAPVALP